VPLNQSPCLRSEQELLASRYGDVAAHACIVSIDKIGSATRRLDISDTEKEIEKRQKARAREFGRDLGCYFSAITMVISQQRQLLRLMKIIPAAGYSQASSEARQHPGTSSLVP